MSERLGPGSTFAGCRLEAVAGRGGMGVVFRATQIALQRPVALKAIAPEYAANQEYRERFQREAHLAASIDHPNVIPVYEAGELDGTLYLMMRWVDGTDLRTLLTTSGPVSPARAIRLLRPVASALSAAHRRGLVHRDIKPGNVMIARSDDESEGHIYLTDFGIARRTDGEPLTRTGMFVGTIDYTAPERIEGRDGEARSDIYALGCVLYEMLTGHVPYERAAEVAKLFAHVNDPIPSVRDEVAGTPQQLDAIITKAMAKAPDDRFRSASELVVALGKALDELETAERTVVTPTPRSQVTRVSARPAQTEAPPAKTEPSPATAEPGTMTEPAGERTRPAREHDATIAAVTRQAGAGQPQTPGVSDASPGGPKRRASRRWWVAAFAVVVVAGVLVAVLSGGGSGGHRSTTSSSSSTTAANSTGTQPRITGSGLTVGRTIAVASQPASVSIGQKNVWSSLPGDDQLVRFNPLTADRRSFAAAGGPTAIAAGVRALWVGEPGVRSLAQFNGDSGVQVEAAKLRGVPTAVALDQNDSSAWVADSSGAISHVAVGGAVIGTPAHVAPAATSINWGEGSLWAVNGADKGLIRVSLGTGGSSTSFAVGPRPVGVTLDQGVWAALANGHVVRFDPRAGRLRVNADIAVGPELDAVAATDPGPFVWAISKRAKTLYRITRTSTPAVSGTVVFRNSPVALAVRGRSVWVATQDGKVTEIQF